MRRPEEMPTIRVQPVPSRRGRLRSRPALKREGLSLNMVPTLAVLLQILWTSNVARKKAGIIFTDLAKPAQMIKYLVFIAKLAEQ